MPARKTTRDPRRDALSPVAHPSLIARGGRSPRCTTVPAIVHALGVAPRETFE